MKYLLFVVILAPLALFAGQPDDILGVWYTKDQEAQIEIYKCGDTYCGKIVDLKEKVYDDKDPMAGKAKVDRENPDKSKRNTPVIGMDLMSGFSHNGKTWSGGTIYDPDNGKTYKCKVKMTKAGKLEVRGYIGVSLIGRTEVWTRKE